MVIHAHEELFFEFNTAGLRDDCTVTILRTLETIKASADPSVDDEQRKLATDLAARENMLLQTARQEGYAEHEVRGLRGIHNIGQIGLSSYSWTPLH